VTLDVYGPVLETYKTRFHRRVETSPATTYCGILQPAEQYAVLQRYDLLVFPTYYSDEGFPGTIVDSFIAGVPVLATDWKYNRELVNPGRTGEIYTARSREHLIATLNGYLDAPQAIADMRQHCIEQAHKYHVDYALQGLLHDLVPAAKDK
jgi:glycosyltransferase involved in cell wall biosynthesis